MNYLNRNNIKTKYVNINPWFFAITVTVLINILLLVLFTPSKIKGINSSVNEPQVIMLPLNNSKHLVQNQLLYWLKDDNPTLIVSPNETYGYSSILNPDFNLSYNNPSFDINSILTPHYFFSIPFSVHPIAVRSLSLEQLFSQLDLINNPNIPATPFPHTIIKKQNYPYVKGYFTGALIPVKFNNIKKIKKLIEKYTPHKPTVLSVNIPSNPLYFPIVNIISSCGSTELDEEALNNLITTNLSNDKSFKGKQIKVYVEWRQSE